MKYTESTMTIRIATFEILRYRLVDSEELGIFITEVLALFRDETIVSPVFYTVLSVVYNIRYFQKLVNTEHTQYGDIVQFDFKDTFRNASLKTVLMLRWASKFNPTYLVCILLMKHTF